MVNFGGIWNEFADFVSCFHFVLFRYVKITHETVAISMHCDIYSNGCSYLL